MRALVWIVEDTWEATVAEAAAFLPADAEVTLLHVAPGDVEQLAEGRATGCSAAGPPPPGPRRAAARHLRRGRRSTAGRGARALRARRRGRAPRGRVEREVVAAAEGMDLLVLARDGDHSRLGPHSLGPPARFVVDHAPCRVLLVWADAPPDVDTIPPLPSTRRPTTARRCRTSTRCGPRCAPTTSARSRTSPGDERLPHAPRALLHRAARSARRALRRRPALRGAVAARCWRRSPRTAAARPGRLRALDHEREITPRLAPARAGGRLRRLRRPLRRHARRRPRAPAATCASSASPTCT